MDPQIDTTMRALDVAKRFAEHGGEYWMARDLQAILGYTSWEKFVKVIERAKAACAGSGMDEDDHFLHTVKMVPGGSGAELERADTYLTRYACYLIAMNGESSKVQIATAQTYFAVQARRQELAENGALLEHRVELRNRLTVAVNALTRTAKEAGLQEYALFHDAGYRGLYTMGLSAIKRRKGIGEKANLFDRAGRAELAANEFHKTQTEQKIIGEGLKGQKSLMDAHKRVGEQVRQTIRKISGVMPENMPPEPSLKQLTREKKKRKKLSGPLIS